MTDSPRDAGPSTNPTPAETELLEQLRVVTRGEYDIFGELGRGGMATVHLAHEISLDRKVAIKVMSPALVHGAGMVERFKREARTAAHLSHPNIIPVYAVREADGLLFFVMKLVEGTPLDAIIKELGKLPIPMVEAILSQVGGAFGYAHRHGVVHRDIKPSNILIDDEGWAVVTDFGIAKVQESEGLTHTGMAVGTPTYMSPEQCSGGAITGASDQYSLGIVAYEMLAGRPPFTATAMMALMYSHFHEPVPPLELFRPDCPEPLRMAVMRMLEKDPAARWPSIEEAVASFGSRQLAHNDPTRSHLISLAKTGLTHRIVSQVQTPRSPVPLTRKSTTPPPIVAEPAAPPAGLPIAKPERRWMLLGLGAVVVAAVAVVLLLRQPGGVQTIARPNEVVPPAASPESPAQASPAPPPGVIPGKPSSRTAPEGRVPASRPAAPSVEAPRGGPAVSPGAGSGGVTPPNPAPAPPPPPPASAEPAVTPSVRVPVETAPTLPARDEKVEVTAAIMAYARALDQGDLALARRLNPGMPGEQRQGLEAFWKAGGTMRTRWIVSEVVITGEEATARVQGTNLVTTPRERPSEQRVNLRARLERRGTEWHLVSLVN